MWQILPQLSWCVLLTQSNQRCLSWRQLSKELTRINWWIQVDALTAEGEIREAFCVFDIDGLSASEQWFQRPGTGISCPQETGTSQEPSWSMWWWTWVRLWQRKSVSAWLRCPLILPFHVLPYLTFFVFILENSHIDIIFYTDVFRDKYQE